MIKTNRAIEQTPPGSSASGQVLVRRRYGDLFLVVGLASLLLLITSVPYLLAYQMGQGDRRFVGVLLNVPDNVQYLSWLRDHRSALLVANRLTAEPNQPALFNLLWLTMARLQVVTGWTTPMLFHLLRFAVGLAAILVVYQTSKLFTRTRGELWTSLLLIACGAGLGWVWVVEKYARGLSDVRFPFDLYVSEPNLVLSMMAFPHFVIATTLILAVFWCYLQAVAKRSWAYAWAAAALALLLTLQHAYDLLILGLMPAGTLALIWLRDRRVPWFGGFALALIGLVSVPPAAYFVYLTGLDPLWSRVLDQFSNAGISTPPPHHLLILMGVPLLLLLVAVGIGALKAARDGLSPRQILAGQSDSDLFLWAWLVVGFVLLYVPSEFQIHMLNAWQVPIALLATRFVYRRLVTAATSRGWPVGRYLPALLLLVSLPTNLYLVAWRVVDLQRAQTPYFISADQDAALSWLEQHSTRDDVVLAGLDTDQFVPARSDARAVVAHWAMTVDYFDKLEAVRAYFDAGTAEAQRRALLKGLGVTYVIRGEQERAFGHYDPATAGYSELAFASGDLRIYRVRP